MSMSRVTDSRLDEVLKGDPCLICSVQAWRWGAMTIGPAFGVHE